MKKTTIIFFILTFFIFNIKNIYASDCIKPAKLYLSVCSAPSTRVSDSCVPPQSTDSILYQAQELGYSICLQAKTSKDRLYSTEQDQYNSCMSSNSKSQSDYMEAQNNYFECLSGVNSCSEDIPNRIYNKSTNKCECKSGYTYTLDSSDKLACMTPKEIQDSPQSPSLKEGIASSQKLYPDAGITGNEKTSEEIRAKIFKSNSYFAYKKIKPLTADQIVENINILGNAPGGTPEDMQNYVDFLKNYQAIPKLTSKKYPAKSVTNFAKVIKSHYPQYNSLNNTTLVKKFIKMYPVLKDRVNLNKK